MRPGRKTAARKATNDLSRHFILASRLLISLFTLLLVATPWTEGYRLLDNFPRSQDSELNLLALVAFLGLILLLTRSCRKKIRALVTIGHWLATILRQVPALRPGMLPLDQPALAESPPGAFNLPLLI